MTKFYTVTHSVIRKSKMFHCIICRNDKIALLVFVAAYTNLHHFLVRLVCVKSAC